MDFEYKKIKIDCLLFYNNLAEIIICLILMEALFFAPLAMSKGSFKNN